MISTSPTSRRSQENEQNTVSLMRTACYLGALAQEGRRDKHRDTNTSFGCVTPVAKSGNLCHPTRQALLSAFSCQPILNRHSVAEPHEVTKDGRAMAIACACVTPCGSHCCR